MYERVRHINNILYMYEHNRSKAYSQLKELILENDIIKCIQLINKIKEYRQQKQEKTNQ